MGCSIVCFLVHLKWTLAVSQGLKSLADSQVHSQTVALRRMCSFRIIDRTIEHHPASRMSALGSLFTILNCS